MSVAVPLVLIILEDFVNDFCSPPPFFVVNVFVSIYLSIVCVNCLYLCKFW